MNPPYGGGNKRRDEDVRWEDKVGLVHIISCLTTMARSAQSSPRKTVNHGRAQSVEEQSKISRLTLAEVQTERFPEKSSTENVFRLAETEEDSAEATDQDSATITFKFS